MCSRGSAIAKIIGHNVKGNNRFDPMVNMWVYEEMIDGRKLTDIINTEHENVKYLPGHKLPKNVVSCLEQHKKACQLHLNVGIMQRLRNDNFHNLREYTS